MKTNKLIFSVLLAAGVSTLTTSCSDFLDKEVDLSLSDENVWSKYENTRGFLANVYTYLPDAFSGYTDTQYRGSNECMTDNAISYWSVHRYHSILSDTYDATNHWFATYYWERNTSAIRAANQFMKNARESVIGNSAKSGDDNKLYDRNIAEARLLRAIFHFDMVCWFGAIPIIGDQVDEEGNRTPIVLKADGSDAKEMTRTSAAEALQWIADECDAVKDVLPFRYTDENSNWARVNGAAAYALKSRALLYLASPLNNPSGSTSLWQNAAQAALDFMTKNNQQSNPYKLYTTSDNDPDQNYYQCFVSSPHLNNEYILSRSEWDQNTIEYNNTPCGFTGSYGRINPTQNLVDAYETKNGLPIDEDPTYDEQNPYENRDPRLEQTIFHHGSWWGDKDNDEYRQIDVTYGEGTDYQNNDGGTTTGYYSKKFVSNMAFSVQNKKTFVKACPIFRYAEILLNAAEALNEAGQTDQAYQYVNQVRARVGMPAYSGMTQSKLRERIQNERRIELCFEDHRYLDERRWKLFEGKTASSEKSLPRYKQVYNLYSVQVTPDGTQTYTYTSNNLHPTRVFNSPKNYYFPIPNEEVKMAPKLGQNTGWELTTSSSDSSSSDSSSETAE